MPFNGGIGLHDAPWQTNFGGDWYLEHGSRGCVNLQYDVAETVFNNVDSGTVVVRSTFAVPPSEAGFILAKIFHPLLKEQLL